MSRNLILAGEFENLSDIGPAPPHILTAAGRRVIGARR